ncbi:MAG: zinc ribbon domain-containing protein [Proteobacteria bacterium]|jgi:putative FmdB family regulatory protein|nr:zinc ribbon domain-containing protein [Pseudomonadota bacterium]
MPIYEYTCKACGHEFEVIQKISDKPIRKCEACGRLQAERHISQTSFLLKGTGWYTTDYAGHKAHGGSEGESTSSAPSSSSESSSTENSKPTASEPTAAPASAETKKAAKPSKKAASA